MDKTGRRRTGCLPLLLVMLLILGLAAVIADRVAARAAEERIEDMVYSEANRNNVTPGSVVAAVGGFPFLTQALAGRFDGGTITMNDVQVFRATDGEKKAGTITLDRVNVKIEGLTVPRDVMTGGEPHDVVAERLTGTASASMNQVATALPIPGLKLTGTGETVHFTAPIPIPALAALQVNGEAALRLRGNRVFLEVQHVEAAGVAVPKSVIKQLASQFKAGAELPVLPLGLKVTSVKLAGSVISVAAAANNADLARR